MSTEERNLAANKYWTNIDDERYLQVEEVDSQCFRGPDDNEDDDDEDKEEDDAKENSDEDHF
jgi:hypothetical protein